MVLPRPPLPSRERSGEDTGSSEEMGAFLNTGEGEREGERDLTNGEGGREPASDGIEGEGGGWTADVRTGGLTSRSSSSSSSSSSHLSCSLCRGGLGEETFREGLLGWGGGEWGRERSLAIW